MNTNKQTLYRPSEYRANIVHPSTSHVKQKSYNYFPNFVAGELALSTALMHQTPLAPRAPIVRGVIRTDTDGQTNASFQKDRGWET